MKGFTTMYDYKWKKTGVVVASIGLLAMIVERLKPIVLFEKLTPLQHYNFYEWLMLAGLFLIVFCKEKYDDDRAKAIRAKSFQISFTLIMGLLLGFSLNTIFIKELEIIDSSVLLTFIAFALMAYLLIFNLGLHFDFLWGYEDKGVMYNIKNIKKHIWAKLAYIAIGIIIITVLSLLPYA